MTRFLCALAICMLTFSGGAALAKGAKPMTNQDVINLVHANVSQNSIILAINGAKPDFDTSADGLIALSKQGVPDPVIQAMIGAESQPTPASAPSVAIGTSGTANPEELILLDGNQRITMHYLTPQMRGGAVALGYGGMRSYAVLMGTQAVLRIKNRQPMFLLAAPNNAQPQAYFTLANFAVRKNGTREVATGGGFFSYSSGIPKDRIMPTSFEKYFDQSHAPAGFTIYKVVTTAPLSDGEYAMIISSSQVHMAGFFTSGFDSYFDFGIGG